MHCKILSIISRRRKCGAPATKIGYGMAYCECCYRRIYGEVRD